MSSGVKRPIKNAFHLFGLDVFWHIPFPRQAMWTLLALYKVDTIFDVGANAGMSGEYFRNMGFKNVLAGARNSLDRIVGMED
jgi:hypothetical protein